MAESLAELFWRRIAEVLKEQGLTQRELKARVLRNKNTLTRWFSDHPPDPKLSDVFDIGRALSVDPTELLTDAGRQTMQLSLPFPEGGISAQIEMRWTGSSIVIRKSASSETSRDEGHRSTG